VATFGQRVKQAREALYLSQAELAVKAGISKNTLNRIETGKAGAIPRTVRRLAEALGVAPASLATMSELQDIRGNAHAA
jgi:transcriptional regulator with XRE-family HTH domain